MDPYGAIADYYDAEHDDFRDDVDFYLQMLEPGSVLEVGVGTGRIALPLARTGFEVWGIDPSPSMLQHARARFSASDAVHLVLGSIETFEFDRRFASVIFPLNTLWHFLTSSHQISALSSARRYLQPDGTLIIDLSNPLTMADRGATGTVRERFTHADSERTITGFSAAWDDEAEQTLTLSLHYDSVALNSHLTRSDARLQLRYIYRPELELLLRIAGFRVDQVYGSYDLDDFSAESPSLIVIAGIGVNG